MFFYKVELRLAEIMCNTNEDTVTISAIQFYADSVPTPHLE